MKKLERFGPYTLLSPLGSHTRSRTWLARAGEDEGAGDATLAFKFSRKNDLAGRARILHEVDLAGAFNHPNIVRIYECAEADGVLWLTCEYVRGPHAPLTLANFRQLLLALVHVHANGVIHANLDPAHLLLDEEGDLRLSNFADARREGAVAAPSSTAVHFSAPEQLDGETLDARADLFAAGVVLYQILTGKLPFDGSRTEVRQQIGGRAARAPSAVAPGLGVSFDALIVTALAPDKAERFGSAFAFLSAFDAACKRGVRPAIPTP